MAVIRKKLVEASSLAHNSSGTADFLKKSVDSDSECKESYSEVSDAFAFRELLKEHRSGDMSAFATLGVAHNLITGSIDKEWKPEGRGRVYCVRQVATQLRAIDEFFGDLKEAKGPVFPQSFVGILPGFRGDCQ